MTYVVYYIPGSRMFWQTCSAVGSDDVDGVTVSLFGL